METEVLSRVCSRQLIDRFNGLALIGGDIECVRMRFVRGVGRDGQRSYVSHVVLAWERADGIRVAARRCVCGQVANPDHSEWGATSR